MDCQINLYNYANDPNTEITAEFLNKEMIFETVDENVSWEGYGTENGWYNFNFHKAIYIDSMEIYLDNPDYRKGIMRNDIAIAIRLKDTTLVIDLKNFANKFSIKKKSSDLLIIQKGTFHHISEIRILSTTIPINSYQLNKRSHPKVNLEEKRRTKISESIWGYSKEKSNAERKYWPKRIRFYNKHILNKNENYKRDIYSKNGYSFCYSIINDVTHLSDKQIKFVNDECGCDLHEVFFERKLLATEIMKSRPFRFMDKMYSYKSDTTEQALIKYIEGGNAWAGHAIPHICLMRKEKYLDKIDSLQNDPNIFTQVQVIKGLLYFNRPKKSLEIAKKIFKKELGSIANDSISLYGCYAWVALQIMNEYYPNEILPLILDLYKNYRALYPNEMKISDHWILAFNYGIDSYKRVESIQGCDESILIYIELYLKRYPHLSNNPILKEFQGYIKEKYVHSNVYDLDD